MFIYAGTIEHAKIKFKALALLNNNNNNNNTCGGFFLCVAAHCGICHCIFGYSTNVESTLPISVKRMKLTHIYTRSQIHTTTCITKSVGERYFSREPPNSFSTLYLMSPSNWCFACDLRSNKNLYMHFYTYHKFARFDFNISPRQKENATTTTTSFYLVFFFIKILHRNTYSARYVEKKNGRECLALLPLLFRKKDIRTQCWCNGEPNKMSEKNEGAKGM